jgi:hypothetical protein
MFSFYRIVEAMERYENGTLQEVAGPLVYGAGVILAIKHLMKKGKERDAMLSCKNECIRVLDRKEYEKCVVECFNRKMVLSTQRYKAIINKN